MKYIREFTPSFSERLPATCRILLDGNLSVHDSVTMITLHGSRGPLGGARPDSDVDLALVVDPNDLSAASDPGSLLRTVLLTTLEHWRGDVEADLAAVFDKSGCGLRCLERTEFDPDLCQTPVGCMGLFKIQRGFDSFVTAPPVDCRKIYPLSVVWRREHG